MSDFFDRLVARAVGVEGAGEALLPRRAALFEPLGEAAPDTEGFRQVNHDAHQGPAGAEQRPAATRWAAAPAVDAAAPTAPATPWPADDTPRRADVTPRRADVTPRRADATARPADPVQQLLEQTITPLRTGAGDSQAAPTMTERDARPSIEATPLPVASLQPVAATIPPAEARHRSSPTIKVTIGRVEVRAIEAPQPRPQPATPRPAAMTLDDYLKRRGGAQ